MKKSLSIMAVSALSLQANAGFWDEVGKAVSILNTVTGGTTTTTSSTSSTSSSSNTSEKRPPFAQLTPAQEQKISQVVIANTGDADLDRAIREAKPNIEGVMRLASCQTDGQGLMAGRFVAPDYSQYWTQSVIPYMKYQPSNHCMSVSSVGKWELVSRSRTDYRLVNKIKFVIVYSSDITPEAVNRYVTMERGDDGQWYLLQHRW